MFSYFQCNVIDNKFSKIFFNYNVVAIVVIMAPTERIDATIIEIFKNDIAWKSVCSFATKYKPTTTNTSRSITRNPHMSAKIHNHVLKSSR